MDRDHAADTTGLLPQFLQRGVGLLTHETPQFLQPGADIDGRPTTAVGSRGNRPGLASPTQKGQQALTGHAEHSGDLFLCAQAFVLRLEHPLSHFQG